jgi:hypothetical protein
MNWERITAFSIMIILLGASACSPQVSGPVLGNAVDTAIAETKDVQTSVANAVASTLAAMVTNTPEFTFTPSLTPTPTFTLTPAFPLISVSVDTNCRTGPGSAYDMVGGLAVGQTAEVIGRDAASQFWLIHNPSNLSVICWLWGKYATVTGDTSGLPIATPPPTPTPIPAVTNVTIILELTFKNGCESVLQFTVTIKTNAPLMVNYMVKSYYEGVEHRTTNYAKNFTSAGTQSFIDAYHELNCGTWGYKVFITSPNSMTSEASYKVIP